MSEHKFDVSFPADMPFVDYHHCREWEEDAEGNMQGCYGTNPNHGFTFEEAKEKIIEFYQKQLEYWQDLTEEEWLNGTGL